MQLFFPLLCLVIGILSDGLAKRLKGIPATVIQLGFACVVTMLMKHLLDAMVVVQVLKNWTWITLEPHVVMTMLLPVLIFESAFRLEVHTFLANLKPIGFLASVCFGFAALIQAGMTGILHSQLLEMDQRWDRLTTLTFASIISATDPVAVVSLLGSLGAPTRLKVLVEGESLCNDGAAVLAVAFLERAILAKEGKIDLDWSTEAPSRISGLLLTFPIGIVTALLCALVMRSIEDGRVQQASVVIGVFAVWMASETVDGSGVVGLVCMGIALRYNRDSMRHNACEECEALWELLAMWANYIIFLLSGIVVGDVLANFDTQENEIILALLVYTVTVISRALALSPFFMMSWILHPGDLPELKYFVIMTLGGLRGAVGLLLAMHISDVLSGVKQHEHGERILYYTAVTVLCSLLFQATITETVVKKLKLNVKAMRMEQDCKRLERQLNSRKKKILEQMSIDPRHFYLGGVNWKLVETITKFHFGHHKKEEESESKNFHDLIKKLKARRTPSADSKLEKTQLVSFQEIEEEARQNLLTMLQKRSWKMWKDCVISRNTISHLDTSLEGVRDKLFKVMAQTEEESTIRTVNFIITHLNASPSKRGYAFGCWLEKYVEPLFTRQSMRMYRQSRTYDWWQLASTAILIYQISLVHQMYFVPATREYVIFFILLTSCGCMMEQIVLLPIHGRFWKRKYDEMPTARHWWFIIYTGFETLFIVYYCAWAILSAYAITSMGNKSDKCIHRDYVGRNEYTIKFVDEGLCLAFFWFPFGIAVRFGVKMFISLCFLVDAFSEHWIERIKVQYMNNLAQMYTLIRISDEICSRTLLDSYSSKVAWRIWDLNGTLREKLEETLVYNLNNRSMISMSNLVKTRQACRALMHGLNLAANDMSSCGLIADPLFELVNEEMEKMEKHVGRLTLLAPEANPKEQMKLVSWINQATDDLRFHNRSPTEIVNFLWPRLKSCKTAESYEHMVWLEIGHVFYHDDNFEDCVYFISEGMVRVIDKDVGEPGYFIYPGNWLGTQALVSGSDKRKRKSRAVAATPVFATKLDLKGIEELMQYDPVIEKRVILEEVIMKAKKLAQALIEDLRMVNDIALVKFIAQELLVQLTAEHVIKMPIPEGVRLVLLHGQVLVPDVHQWLSVHVCDDDMIELPKNEVVVKPLTPGDQAYILRLEVAVK